jgi:glycosyltransferase involved in cell wall biosynthesis
MKHLGWKCDLVSPPDLVPNYAQNGNESYPTHLREYLRRHQAQYDVVDYDHHHLPFARMEFPSQMLLVARSVLLQNHLDKIVLPQQRNLKTSVGTFLRTRQVNARRWRSTQNAHTTLREADLINVANHLDQETLRQSGIPTNRITVIPYGLSRSRRKLFDSIPSSVPDESKIAFVGTFDNRKGCADFPLIVRAIHEMLPKVSFRLLGTGRNERTVRAHFPRALRGLIEVIPLYDPDYLPDLLKSCAVGIFPSYVEGFGFGVLEMLAASIPVFAYNSPGPPMMLPAKYLTIPGDVDDLSKKVVKLLRNRDELAEARIWAKQRSRDFCWEWIAKQTSAIYVQEWQRKQVNLAPLAFESVKIL